MAQPYRIWDEDRTKRRTVAEAVEFLRERRRENDLGRAKIHVSAPFWHDGRTAFVQIQFDDVACAVSLPSSAYFKARHTRSEPHCQFDISALHLATVSPDGSVTLASGIRLYAVEVVPTPLLYDLSELDRAVLRYAAGLPGAGGLRQVAEGLPIDWQSRIGPAGKLERLDYARLRTIEIKSPLKVIKAQIESQSRVRISLQKISDTLAAFGIRPRRRRRRRMPS